MSVYSVQKWRDAHWFLVMIGLMLLPACGGNGSNGSGKRLLNVDKIESEHKQALKFFQVEDEILDSFDLDKELSKEQEEEFVRFFKREILKKYEADKAGQNKVWVALGYLTNPKCMELHNNMPYSWYQNIVKGYLVRF